MKSLFITTTIILLSLAGMAQTRDTSITFVRFDVRPEFPGGDAGLALFLKNNIRYPAAAAKQALEGNVYVSFIIEADGSVTGAKIGRGLGKELDDEALRVVRLMPRWKPGIRDGQPVRAVFNLPISFKKQ